MTIQKFCDLGGWVAVETVSSDFVSESVEIKANVKVSYMISNERLFTVKGMLKRFPSSGKWMLDFRNSKNKYPNFMFGKGFYNFLTVRLLRESAQIAAGSTGKHLFNFRVEEGKVKKYIPTPEQLELFS